jgi:hypothetical protein
MTCWTNLLRFITSVIIHKEQWLQMAPSILVCLAILITLISQQGMIIDGTAAPLHKAMKQNSQIQECLPDDHSVIFYDGKKDLETTNLEHT